MAKQKVTDLEVKGRRVFCRVDFNVPLKESRVDDDTRIREALPTIKYLVGHGAKVILASHLGRPKEGPDPEFSLKPVAERLSELLNQPVAFAEDCVGQKARAVVDQLGEGEVCLLENVRFHPGETKGAPALSRQMAELADLFVNDAFGSSHRAHCSVVGVPQVLGQGAAGFLLLKEIEYFTKALEAPERPLVVILGGLKVKDKVGVIENLLEKADQILIGGAMAYTFFKAQGIATGASPVEDEMLETARGFLARAREKGVDLVLPVDHVIADAFAEGAHTRTITSGEGIPDGWQGMDIGPQTTAEYIGRIRKAGTVIWNGPMGVFEMAPFARATFAIARALAEAKATSIIGGGDSVSAVNKSGVADKIDHISTGGGASLELLEGKVLPGLAALSDVCCGRPTNRGRSP